MPNNKSPSILWVARTHEHFASYRSVLQLLLDSGCRIHYTYDPETSQGTPTALQDFQEKNAGKPFQVIPFHQEHGVWRCFLTGCRDVLSYRDYLNRPDQSPFYTERWKKYLPEWFRKKTKYTWFNRLVQTRLTKSLLDMVEQLAPPPSPITCWLQENSVGLVVATPANMRKSREVEYLKAAKALHIPTVVPTYSWDNLTTKGMFHCKPDWLLAWNNNHQADAIAYHGFRREQIIVTGAWTFDKWFIPNPPVIPRDEFCQQVGLNPERPYFVYLGSSKNIAKDESWIIRNLARLMREHTNPLIREMGILIRPHPANTEIYEGLEQEQVVIWPKQGSINDDTSSEICFRGTLLHSIGSVGINTTGMVDAIIQGKPCISILTEEYRKTQEQALHFQDLLEADVLMLPQSIEECIDTLAGLLDGEDPKVVERARFIRNFVRPHGFEASVGKVAAGILLQIAAGQMPQAPSELERASISSSSLAI